MAIYRRTSRGAFRFDFVLDGARFVGSTGEHDRARALAVEDARREDARQGRIQPIVPRPAPASADVAAAWDASVEVVAAAYGVAPQLLRIESAGRGPRPPPAAWEARKMAIHLTVIVADCNYSEVGRLVGLHKDTAASHCASLRDACAESDGLEELSLALETCIRIRLSLAGTRATAVRSAA